MREWHRFVSLRHGPLVISYRLNEDPIMRCAAQDCSEVWTHDDWRLCGHAVRTSVVCAQLPDVVQTAFNVRDRLMLKRCLREMTDVRICPLCETSGWIVRTPSAELAYADTA